MKYVIGLLAIFIGVLMIIKTEWFLRSFGTSAWAEQHLGTSGGTRLMYKLIGIIIIFLSMSAMTGILGTFVLSVFGKFFGM